VIVLVCGGRAYFDRARVFEVLDRIHADEPITRLVDGAAPGADSLGHRWAVERRVPTSRYRAAWTRYGLAAGGIRNRRMYLASKPDLVVAFPGGSGTADMVKVARAGGTRIVRVDAPEPIRAAVEVRQLTLTSTDAERARPRAERTRNRRR